MPKITLYVKESEAFVWERAKAVVFEGDAGSLSAFVTRALKLALDAEESKNRRGMALAAVAARAKDFVLEGAEQDDVNENHDKAGRIRLRFRGVEVTHDVADWAVYVTQKGEIVVNFHDYVGIGCDVIAMFDTIDDMDEEHGIANDTDVMRLKARLASLLGVPFDEEEGNEEHNGGVSFERISDDLHERAGVKAMLKATKRSPKST